MQTEKVAQAFLNLKPRLHRVSWHLRCCSGKNRVPLFVRQNRGSPRHGRQLFSNGTTLSAGGGSGCNSARRTKTSLWSAM